MLRLSEKDALNANTVLMLVAELDSKLEAVLTSIIALGALAQIEVIVYTFSLQQSSMKSLTQKITFSLEVIYDVNF